MSYSYSFCISFKFLTWLFNKVNQYIYPPSKKLKDFKCLEFPIIFLSSYMLFLSSDLVLRCFYILLVNIIIFIDNKYLDLCTYLTIICSSLLLAFNFYTSGSQTWHHTSITRDFFLTPTPSLYLRTMKYKYLEVNTGINILVSPGDSNEQPDLSASVLESPSAKFF